MEQPVQPQFYRVTDIANLLSVSVSSIWGWVKKGTFPSPIKLSANITAWEVTAVDSWIKARKESELNK